MKPAIATVCIINFITCLNNFFTPLFYSNGIQVLSVAIVQLHCVTTCMEFRGIW